MTAVDATFELFEETPASGLFRTSSPLTVLDHFRVPYELHRELGADGVEQLRASEDGPALFWTRDSRGPALASELLGADRTASIPLFTRLLTDQMIEPLLPGRGSAWERARYICSTDGAPIASIWRAEDGSVFLPFDPNEVVESFWSESYLGTAAGHRALSLRRALMMGYYRARPLLPRPVQIWLRRQFARLQARSSFPRWPVETCLHDFFDLILGILAELSGEPVPCMAPWPNGHTWAFVLTHDVEHAEGFAVADRVIALERAQGLRSSWNLVPKRYETDPAFVTHLKDVGFEVGVHGVHHDGRDLESWSTWQQRLPVAHEAAESWDAVGFRSAACHRHPEWMRSLDFDYDSSWPDTDPFEPQTGGCCTWLPFFNGELVELPLTLGQDHTLFVILGEEDDSAWMHKTNFLRDRGGMAMMDTHPDYLIDERIFSAYSRFLERYSEDPTAWQALPREVSAWWRRRAQSWLEHDGSTWRVAGPAELEGRVTFAGGSW